MYRLADAAGASKRAGKKTLLLTAIALLVLALANPQVGTRLEEVKQEGVDLFLALDVSLSMKAEDMKPNRLDRAKFEIQNLISRLQGDRIGLVVFAADAFTQFPLTSDYGAANLFLDVVDVDAVPMQGTAIGSAIERATESFDFNDPTTKVIIIISDGENTEGNAFEAAEEAAALVNAMHITASVFINDDEPALHDDYKRWLEQLAPYDPSPDRYHHNRTGEDNGDAHHKRQVMGREVVVAVTNGVLDFGPWERIFYGEFDGNRPKRVLVKVIGE